MLNGGNIAFVMAEQLPIRSEQFEFLFCNTAGRQSLGLPIGIVFLD